MGKKVKEYKAGDFIFAKVKGYPAWPARVQRLNGKKYFVYFYGTGEIANLAPNMIFDYAENKDKFLTKTIKRKDFNDGVKQIAHDFANNVPVEKVVGIPIEQPMDINDTANDSTINDEEDESVLDNTADATTTDDKSQYDTTVDDSDDTGALVIDEGKKGRKFKVDPMNAVSKSSPKVTKEAKTPRGKGKKDEKEKEDETVENKKEEEIVSRSGRKIRPKRYLDEETEENATISSPVSKKRRTTPPPTTTQEKDTKTETKDKSPKQFISILQSELEELTTPPPSESEKKTVLVAYLPSDKYVGIKLFQSKPSSFKNDAAKLQWYKQAAKSAITLKSQLEKGQTNPESIAAQLDMDLNLTDEEKANLDKEREIDERKLRVQFLKTEMKLIELDAKIKTCLSLEKADTELCLKLLDELSELDIRPLMLWKHPTCIETIKRMRAYVGNTPSWDLSDSDALAFSKQAHKIRKQADLLYKSMKNLFPEQEVLSFWEYFSERVLQFKKVTSSLSADELLEMVHEPIEMLNPSSHTMKAAAEEANSKDKDGKQEDENKKKATSAKENKAANSTPAKTSLKRQSSRNKNNDEETKTEESDSKKDDESNKHKNKLEDKPEKVKGSNKSEKSKESDKIEKSKKSENDKPDKTKEEESDNSDKQKKVGIDNSKVNKKDDDDKSDKEQKQETEKSEKSKKLENEKTQKNKKDDSEKSKKVENDKTEKNKKDFNDKTEKNKRDNSDRADKNKKDLSDKIEKSKKDDSDRVDKNKKDVEKENSEQDKKMDENKGNRKTRSTNNKQEEEIKISDHVKCKETLDKTDKKKQEKGEEQQKESSEEICIEKNASEDCEPNDKQIETSEHNSETKELEDKEKTKDTEKQESENHEKDNDSGDSKNDSEEKDKQDFEEPRAKRPREAKKTDPATPKTPTKRKSSKS